MRKLVFLSVLLTVLALVSVASANGPELSNCAPDCQGEGDVVIIPYLVPEVAIYPDQSLTLVARWGTCTKGLTLLAQRSIILDWVVDGVERQVAWPGSRDEWSAPSFDPTRPAAERCLMGDGIWITYFEWPLGELDVGDYEINLRYGLRFPVIDGIDDDEDGRPDRYYDPLIESVTVVHVVEP